MYEYWQNR